MKLNTKNKNFIIYQSFKNKIPIRDISKKFNYSTNGIRKIINMYNKNEQNTDILEISIMGKTLGLRQSEIDHIQKTLHAYGYNSNNDGWRDLLPEDLYEIPNLDPWYVDVIWMAQRIND